MRSVVSPGGFKLSRLTVQAAVAACIDGVDIGLKGVVGSKVIRSRGGMLAHWVAECRLGASYIRNTSLPWDRQALNLAAPDLWSRVTWVTTALLGGVSLDSMHGVQVVCVNTGKVQSNGQAVLEGALFDGSC